MLFKQAFRIAHQAMMALDKDSRITGNNHAGSGKRARAYGDNADRLAQRGKFRDQRA